MRGKFIVIEGQDGLGKTTQAKLLCDYCTRLGRPVASLREPGGTSLGEDLRTLIKGHTEDIDPYAELMLLCASRIQLVKQVIEPTLAEGTIVVCDRYFYSSIAYQIYGYDLLRSSKNNQVFDLVAASTRGLYPDATIFLTGNSWRGLDGNDYFERHTEDYFDRVAEGYDKMAEEYSNLSCVNANRPVHEVHASIIAALHDLGCAG
jgi:dTMP kinase